MKQIIHNEQMAMYKSLCITSFFDELNEENRTILL